MIYLVITRKYIVITKVLAITRWYRKTVSWFRHIFASLRFSVHSAHGEQNGASKDVSASIQLSRGKEKINDIVLKRGTSIIWHNSFVFAIKDLWSNRHENLVITSGVNVFFFKLTPSLKSAWIKTVNNLISNTEYERGLLKQEIVS